MLESAIGAAHCLAMATKSNIRYPSDVFPSNRFFDRDLGLPETQLSGPSQIIAQPGPGIGVEPDPEQLERLTVEQTLIEPGG
jgi:O-succinylbenzoate synthase